MDYERTEGADQTVQPWKVQGEKDLIITEGTRLVGSIIRLPKSQTGYRVEIMWSGPGGDIAFEAPSMQAALAFVSGIEQGWRRIRLYDGS